jgi:cytidylate kinase
VCIVTIRGQMGSGSQEIGRNIASNLNYEYIDQEITRTVALRTKHSHEGITQKEMPAGTFAGRILESLNSTYPAAVAREGAYVQGWEFSLEDKYYLEALQEVILELAQNGNIVINGRGSHFILQNFPDSLHILTVAPLELRVKRVMDSLHIDEVRARKEINGFDSSRREFIKRYFKSEIEDPVNYDLVINTERMNYQEAATFAAHVVSSKNCARRLPV